ncbi:MAG: transcription-repair coupling factor, partial [Treponema sp.]|nr:transcription-repair coupling factor [Treponema sp.]
IINAELNVKKEYEFLYRKARLEFPALPPKKMLIPLKTTLESLLRCILFKTVLSSEVEKSTENNENLVSDFSFSAGTAHFYFGNIQFFKDEIASLQAESWKIVIFANGENQARRIEEVTKNIQSSESESSEEESKDRGKTKNAKSSKLDGTISIIPSEISEGFTLHEKKLLVIQENEIFGRKKHISKSFKKAKSSVIDTFVELNPGDYCVHVQYGIAKFLGIERVKAAGSERDYIKLEYAGSEFVFVPIEQLDMVQRYIGGDGENPKLDTIGSKAWENRKNKVKQSVEDIAKKLIDLYSRRKLAKGFPFPKDSEYQSMFEAAFPYEDTDDQVTVTAEVKADMEKDIPMDRLICGDVGYGKTEIALRAAFKACMGGKQVAFLAPTTILAQQHYETALERFSHFPIKIGLLSRFVSKQNQKKTLDLILKGNIDIIIGTHRIIQKDVVFKNLGLMIIDEEQRFGVKDKDKLKEIKTNIDCLSLSATPIPRTLHMSLLKIRDMSLLTTPPQNRQAIETIIDEYSEERVASAIRNEVSREGQVFYLHNRVETLLEVKQKLEHIVPEFLIEVAHGKMTSNELDDIFHRFKNAAFHVLISTTIIENGIDIPNVNTIIIDRADMYGVSQLYQLRGRVGRSDRKAYAYLLHPKGKALSEVAMKRLQVISDFTELGSGFKIAMKDMEIRGAGNLLGKDQSGNVYAVGFDLYLRLLSECIERLMAQKDYKEDSDVVLELEYSAFIPDSYIQNTQVKMEVYKKIASIQSEDDLYSVTTELIDRFGDFGEEITSLLSLAEIRILCKKLNISSLKEKNGIVVVEFSRVADISVEKIVKLISESGGRVLLDSNRANVILLKTGKIGLKEKSSFIYENLHKIA